MDGIRFDALVRTVTPVSRRFGLGLLISLGLLGSAPPAEAGRRKKGRRKKRKPRTCAEQCGPECTWCFHRPDSATLCGDSFAATGCNPCASDNDCLGTEETPYCTTHRTARATGERFRWDGPPENCSAYLVGMCTDVQLCSMG